MKFQRYYDAVRYIESLGAVRTGADFMLHRRGDPSVFLRRTKSFLKLLGNPERGLDAQRPFKYIHITGTAGKGTTATMVHNILVASGQRTGLFTSPFVTTSIEKITVNGTYIRPTAFADLVEQLKPAVDTAFRSGQYGVPSYFELYFALAMLYFKQQRCRWVVLEAGLGGKYDATNIIPAPKVSAITNIDYDHMHILGPTLRHIALDKAGIIKRGSVFYTTETRPQILKILKTRCATAGARWGSVDQRIANPNARLASAIGHKLGLKNSAVTKGIGTTRLPARFEIVQRKPLVIIDGAHNRAKIDHTVRRLAKIKFRRLLVVLALAANKDARQSLQSLIKAADHVFVTRFQVTQRKAALPDKLARVIKSISPQIKTETLLDPQQALGRALSAARSGDAVLVTGSFFLAGELRKHWYPEERVLSKRTSF